MFRRAARRVWTRSLRYVRNSRGIFPAPVLASIRGGGARTIAHLFFDGFRGLNPCLALRETHARELGSFDHSGTVRLQYAPVVDKRYFAKPIVLSHISPSQSSCAFHQTILRCADNLAHLRPTSNQVNTPNESRVNSLKRSRYPRCGLGVVAT